MAGPPPAGTATTSIDAFAARRGVWALVLMRMLPVFNFGIGSAVRLG